MLNEKSIRLNTELSALCNRLLQVVPLIPDKIMTLAWTLLFGEQASVVSSWSAVDPLIKYCPGPGAFKIWWAGYFQFDYAMLE